MAPWEYRTHTHLLIYIYIYIHIIYHLSIDLSIDRSIYLPLNICFDYLCSQPGASPDLQTFDFNIKSQNLRVHSTWLNKPLVDVDVFYRCEMVLQHRWSTAGLYCGKPRRKNMWYLEPLRTNYRKTGCVLFVSPVHSTSSFENSLPPIRNGL